LLLAFMSVHFEGPRRGTPPQWNAERLKQFETHVAFAREQLALSGDASPSQERMADFLKENLKQLYGHLSASTIRRYMSLPPPAARNLRR
jgi:hypothetical protein